MQCTRRSTAHWPRSHCINQQTGVCGADSKIKLSFMLRIFLIRISTTWPSSIVYRRQVAEGTAALMYTALLSSQGFTSVTVQVLRPAALENWRNELRSDPVFAPATQCTSKEAV